MMKKLFAGLLDALHILATAFLFAAAFWTSPLTARVHGSKFAGVAADYADALGSMMKAVLLDRGPWLAAAALICIAAAGFLRGDGAKLTSMLRLLSAGAVLLIAMWSVGGLSDQYMYRAWNSLLVATGVGLLLTGFMVSGGKGGSSGGSKKSSDAAA